jgi:ribosomal protein S18 acetylase RimI-like enzyme
MSTASERPTFLVTRFTQADRNILLRLERRVFQRDAYVWGDFLAIMRRGPDLLFVARSSLAATELCGYICGYMSTPDEGYIASIGVDASVRRSGLGNVLMDTLRSHLSAKGARTLTLHVRTGNTAAQALYAKHGFVIERRIPHYFPFGPDEGAAYFMRAVV